MLVIWFCNIHSRGKREVKIELLKDLMRRLSQKKKEQPGERYVSIKGESVWGRKQGARLD
jgi:hypothetical protein